MRYIVAVIPMIFSASFAYADDMTCPQTIDVAPQSLAQDVTGWRTFFDKVNNRYALETVSLYSGAPEGLGSLVPDENNKNYSQWKLYDNGKQSYFLTCGYTHTSVQLTRELSPAFKNCRVTYEKNVHNMDGGPVPLKVTCE